MEREFMKILWRVLCIALTFLSQTSVDPQHIHLTIYDETKHLERVTTSRYQILS